jgi:hypothetical protein
MTAKTVSLLTHNDPRLTSEAVALLASMAGIIAASFALGASGTQIARISLSALRSRSTTGVSVEA